MHEFLGKSPNFKILGLQKHNNVTLIEPENGKYNDVKSTENAKEYITFTRYTDIVVEGENDNGPLFVELKSYPAHYNKTTQYQDSATKNTIKRKFPVWAKTKEKSTSVHRQVILDTVLSSEHPIPGIDDPVRAAGDFRWYFQDWPLTDPKLRAKELKHDGNALTRVKVRDRVKGVGALYYLRALTP